MASVIVALIRWVLLIVHAAALSSLSCTPHYDLESVVGQGALQCLGFVPRCPHPDIARASSRLPLALRRAQHGATGRDPQPTNDGELKMTG